MKLCDFDIGIDKPFFLIAGTCVIESEQMAIDTAPYPKGQQTDLS
jgi:2-dehydro-3-deoxyphosphooctonate aldolase (KDO 8-P synthase)